MFQLKHTFKNQEPTKEIGKHMNIFVNASESGVTHWPPMGQPSRSLGSLPIQGTVRVILIPLTLIPLVGSPKRMMDQC